MSFTHVVCLVCEKKFQQNNKFAGQRVALSNQQGEICYGCALDRLTEGGAPEEGEFNSALIISGEITDQEAQWLEDDLRSVEEGRSVREPYEEEYEEEQEPLDPSCDLLWCYRCNMDIAYCKCEPCSKCSQHPDFCECYIWEEDENA